MLVVHATFPIDPAHRDRALEAIATLAEASREEPGVRAYRAATDVSDPTLVHVFEQYEDASAFEAHAQSEHFADFEAALPDLLAGAPEAVQFEVESATELDL